MPGLILNQKPDQNIRVQIRSLTLKLRATRSTPNWEAYGMWASFKITNPLKAIPMFCAAIIGIVLSAGAHAQVAEKRPSQIDTSTECKQCRIVLTKLTTLGSFNDPLSIYGFPHVLKMNSKGLFFAIPRPASALAVYDRSGKLVKTIGRAGKGPGEFLAVTQIIIDAQDTIIAVDEFGKRISVFDPSGKFVRALSLNLEETSGSTSARLPDGSLVIGGTSFTSDRIGLPLHLLPADGSPMRSFGAERPIYDPRNSAAAYRKITVSGDLVWATRIDRYHVEAWDATTGIRKHAFMASPSWFPLRNTTPRIIWGEVRPLPWMKDLAVDESGMIWLVAVVARNDWKRSPGAKYDSGRLRDDYQTVVEVVNPKTSRVVTRTFVPEYIHGFAGPGVLYSHRETSDGDIVYDVWQVTLTKGVDSFNPVNPRRNDGKRSSNLSTDLRSGMR